MENQADNVSAMAGYTSEEYLESSSSDSEDEPVDLAPDPRLIQVPKTGPLVSKKAPRSFVRSESRLGERLRRDPYDRENFPRKEQATPTEVKPTCRVSIGCNSG